MGWPPKQVWYWVALTEVEHLFKGSNTDKEVQLLYNILRVLLLTIFKSHLKSITGDLNQNDEGTWGRDRRIKAPGSRWLPKAKDLWRQVYLDFFLVLPWWRRQWGRAQSKEEPFLTTASDWSGLSLELVGFLLGYYLLGC